MNTNEHSWVLISAHEYLWVFVGTKEHSGALKSRVPWCCHHSLVLMSPQCHAHECSRHHSVMLMRTLECPWGLMSTPECLWVLISAYECSWCNCTTLMSAQSCLWAFITTHEQSWPLISMGQWRQQHLWGLMTIHEHGAMASLAPKQPWLHTY